MTEIDEQKAVWRAAGYRVETSETRFNGVSSYTVRIMPRALYGDRALPHSWEDTLVYDYGTDEQAVTVAALRKAATKWPGVV